MKRDMIELYSDYLLSSFGQTTATGLSSLLQGAISHDKITRFLNTEPLDSKTLWTLVKPTVRQIERDTQQSIGYLIFDDTVQAKPHSQESETICWHYDHTVNKSVKGINIINCLYHKAGTNIPIAFEVITKPVTYTDEKTGQEKRRSEITKNKRLITMFDTALNNKVAFKYVLMDSWFSAKATFKHIRHHHKHFISALKGNRHVALSLEDKQNKNFTRIDEIDLPDKHPVLGYIKEYADAVLFICQRFINKDGSTGTLYLVCSDLLCKNEDIISAYQKRWRIEQFHKSVKQNAGLAKSPAFSETARRNHIFLSVYATFKLECLSIKTQLNPFAIRARLLMSATWSAFVELGKLQAA